jgi:hypothetical protein
VQRNWSPDVVLRIASLLVDAHVLASHRERAVALCDTVYYNLRQSRGGLDPQTLRFADRLAALHKRAGRRRDATRVHEDVVCDLDEHLAALEDAGPVGGDAAAEQYQRDERLRAVADAHLDGLRRCGWATRQDGLRATGELYGRLRRYGPLTVPPVEQWGAVNGVAEEKKEKETTTAWAGPIEWILVGADADKEARKGRKRDSVAPAKERWGCWGVRPGEQLQVVY